MQLVRFNMQCEARAMVEGLWGISGRAARLPAFPIRQVFDLAEDMARKGRSVVQLALGRPDFDTPPHVLEAAAAALGAGKVHYTSNRGLPELRRAVSAYTARRGVEYDPDAEIVVTVGSGEGIFCALAALVEPGDEVVLFSPYYPAYAGLVEFFGGKPVIVECR
ncbi:MAG: aminotransferase class I/II-fold pyridoxal phosphate-dependent enzyme, partial [Firmicutes bacterium]|nr:aminotransferase class I/II-fold pyridoxal phosphate-dependent enzyme [Bacillota bacterium]